MASSYFSSLRGVVWHGIKSVVYRDEASVIQDSIEILIGLRKMELGSYRFFHSLRLTTIMDLQVLSEPRVIFAKSSNSLATNSVGNLSVVGTFSQTFSVPSVSGPALEACSSHIDFLSNSCQMSKRQSQSNLVTRRSASAFVESNFGGSNFKHGQLLLLPYTANNLLKHRSIVSHRQARILLKNQTKPRNAVICRYLLFHRGNRLCILSAFSGVGSRHFHSLAPTCLSAGTVRDVSFISTPGEKPLETDAISLEGRISSKKPLKLLSGSCYLPHPDKKETGGDDAHFICVDEQVIGVADGVGGWADLGVDAGQYSRELMSNTVSAIHEEPKGSLNLARVLEKAHSRTKSKGSSTACIIALTDQGLHAINLGDSGFMVVRDGCTTFLSPVQQHDFNFTYQLESGNNGDLPSSGQVFEVPVASGDVIIAGTDGLFDNLYSNEITTLVVQAMRCGSGPQVTAQKIAALAHERAQAKDRQTPFSKAAQDAGYLYHGGKLDDITVVVSYISSSTQKK